MTSLKEQKSAFLIQPKEYQLTPWKNGLGVTSEILIFPEGSSLLKNDFAWRLSTAEMSEDGQFSAFPDYNRYLVLIEGSGLKLFFEKKEVILRNGEVFHFLGTSSPSYELVQGPVRDFNLIYDAVDISPHLKMLQIGSKPRSFRLDGDVTLIFGVSNRSIVTLYPGEEKYSIEKNSTLQIFSQKKSSMKEEKLVLIESAEEWSTILVIELNMK